MASDQMLLLLLFFSFLFPKLTSADALLQNPDFETPPSNLLTSSNNSSSFITLNPDNNTIPGWSFEGTVQYVTANQNISLPDKGHAILLGEEGKINQSFGSESDFMHNLLTFALVSVGGKNCSETVGVEISAPDVDEVFVWKQGYGTQGWESFGVYLGSWDVGETVNLVIQSQTVDSNSSSICWPVIDSILVKTLENPVPSSGNLLLNGGFELGPELIPNTTEGILLNPAATPLFSPLLQWSIIGTIKYVDSKNFFVPLGNSAIEIISGASPAGIQTQITLTEGSSYNLEFMFGDAKDSCVGDFVLGVQGGSIFRNFTLTSNGTGSAQKFSWSFKAASGTSVIGFLSYTSIQTKAGVLCGPVIDDVVLVSQSGSTPPSHGLIIQLPWKLLIFMLLGLFLCFL